MCGSSGRRSGVEEEAMMIQTGTMTIEDGLPPSRGTRIPDVAKFRVRRGLFEEGETLGLALMYNFESLYPEENAPGMRFVSEPSRPGGTTTPWLGKRGGQTRKCQTATCSET